ncbi:FAXC [Branchiostoma lanceolatum]|uniref:FAXC protein n=1 Tax=Branchiostoma lanceolatum TaxID=7740 RepID=A0A8K0EH56_BRALA|nr:FAXC [Branchiostoma lanceolatum]
MSGLLQSLGVPFQAVKSSVLQLLTDPAQLSCVDLAVLGVSAACVTVAVQWTCSGEEFRIQKVKVRADFTPGKVYYHAAPPVKAIPCLTPFGVKLETYMRMADIPYEPSPQTVHMGPKGKIPWIEYNGRAMGDSNLIIEFLNKEKGVDLNRSLRDADRAVSRAFVKMLEENTYWGFGRCRWVDAKDKQFEMFELPWLVFFFFLKPVTKKIKKFMWAHGIGRHSKDELEAIIEKDLKALSNFLGSKPFLMGDEPTEADAAVFGLLAEILWTIPDSYMYRIVTKDCPNLQAYCIRMKERYWPDWDQLTGNTKKDQ